MKVGDRTGRAMLLDRSFYARHDARIAARELIGKVLVSRSVHSITAGVITETEAYMGIEDRASHSYGGRRTKRNEVMYAAGGCAYVYLCYGIHHLFNVVVSQKDVPQAVLIRAIHPVEGQGTMLDRLATSKLTTNGPGTLTQALGITTSDNGTDLLGRRIWIEDRGIKAPQEHILVGPRVGVEYAGADALLPYRYRIAPSHLR